MGPAVLGDSVLIQKHIARTILLPASDTSVVLFSSSHFATQGTVSRNCFLVQLNSELFSRLECLSPAFLDYVTQPYILG
jgi:hypothetical protein